MSLTRKIDPRHFSTVYGHTVNKVKDFVEKEILKGEDKPWTLTTSLDEGDTRPMVLVLDKEPMSLSYWRLPLDLESEDEQRRKPFLNTVHYLPEIYNEAARQQYYDRLALNIDIVRTKPFLFAFQISISAVESGYYIIENGVTKFYPEFLDLPLHTEPFEIRIPIKVKDKVKLSMFEVIGKSLDILSDPIKGNFEIKICDYKLLNENTSKKSTAKSGITPVKSEESSKGNYFNVYPDNKPKINEHVDGIGRLLIKLINDQDNQDKLLKKIERYIDGQVRLPYWFN